MLLPTKYKNKMNDEERAMWVENDEGLYNWRQREGGSMRDFLRRNRRWIDNIIEEATGPRHSGEPTHEPREGGGQWTN